MGFLETIVAWIIKAALEWIYSRAAKAVREAAQAAEEARKRNELNEENSKKYHEAVGREERIRKALDLINRNKSN